MTTTNKETIKTFLLYLLLAAVAVLSVNTYLQNVQLSEMQLQIRELQDLLINNQELINNNKNMLGNLSLDEDK